MAINPISSVGQIKPIESLTGQSGAVGGTSSIPFADILSSAIGDVAATGETSAADALGLITGNGDDLHTIMINAALETTAIETATELTTRVVSAYKEIMQMQI